MLLCYSYVRFLNKQKTYVYGIYNPLWGMDYQVKQTMLLAEMNHVIHTGQWQGLFTLKLGTRILPDERPHSDRIHHVKNGHN